MHRMNIITALVVAAIIAIVIFAREPLRMIFTNTPSQEAVNSAKDDFTQAQATFNAAQKAIKTAELDLQSKTEAADKAKESLEAAREKLAKVEKDPLAIDKLAASVGAPNAFVVEVLKSEAVEIQNGVSLSGKAEAARKLTVVAETSGLVISDPLPSGKTILAGDALCALDPGTSGATLEQAKAAFNTAATQLNVSIRLNAQGLASKANLQSSRAAFEQAQAALDQAEQQVQRLVIKAPFAGVLENQTAEKGSLLQPGAACATIVALDRVNLVAYAAESQINAIRLGAQSQAFINNALEPVTGAVTFVASTADPVTRAYRVEVNIANPDETILDGSSARVNIALAGTKGHLVPQNAITLNAAGEIGVMTYNDGAAEFKIIQVVRDTQDGTWITGLDELEEIIIAGQEYAADGRKIKAQYSDKSATTAADTTSGAN